jgi:esterase/lipase
LSLDRIVFQDADRITAMMDTITEAFTQGIRGPAQEMRLVLNHWGFDLKKITYPITIWQGKLYVQIPVSHAEVYKTKLPQAQLRLLENEAHVSTLYNHIQDILESVKPE